jgi:hypothetical protein
MGIKPRSQATYAVDLIHSVLPEARYVFLYRDGLSWSKSWYHHILRQGWEVAVPEEDKPGAWRLYTAQSETSYLDTYLEDKALPYYLEEIHALGWAFALETYLRDLAAGVPYYALRYNELNGDSREATLAELLAHCALPGEAVDAALSGFEEDSQRGTTLARDIPIPDAVAFGEAQAQRFRQMLARHPRLKNPDLLLPDIYHPERLL